MKHFSRACCFKTQPKNKHSFNKFPKRIQTHTICPAYVHFRQTSRHSFFSLYLVLSCHVPISSLCQFTVHLGLVCLVGQRRWYNGIGCQGWSVSWYRFGLENEERREAAGIEGWRKGRVVIELNALTKRVVIKRADNGWPTTTNSASDPNQNRQSLKRAPDTSLPSSKNVQSSLQSHLCHGFFTFLIDEELEADSLRLRCTKKNTKKSIFK